MTVPFIVICIGGRLADDGVVSLVSVSGPWVCTSAGFIFCAWAGLMASVARASGMSRCQRIFAGAVSARGSFGWVAGVRIRYRFCV
ncbi:hypothetical protein [Pedobacter miscanthi]|uniref:Uncharacterized protein n=1 Tax=Pedobacter miscanthi TaxID=2259170 RepID=A0A366LD65_9SPHI|nr:hypothetical protein [Pedobacter miscanthi]RBQ11710.1 hypothetical protein DRW42_00055 [Pedobacter miscanthi]